MPRSDRHTVAAVELSHAERAIVDRMKVLAGTATDPNLLRIALWSLADHYDLDMPNGAFDLREGSGKWKRTRKNPRISQRDEPVFRAKPKTPVADHPWRGPDRRQG